MSEQQSRGQRGRGGNGGDRGGKRGGQGGRGFDRSRGPHPIFDATSGGRGRGDRGGFRGDRGGRGNRGGFRGGRGGGFRASEVYSLASGGIPAPDPKVQKVEDSYKGPASSGNELSLESLSSNRNFPLRPAFGTQGKPVLLWANYFEMVSSFNLTLYRYKVEVQEQEGRTPVGKKLQRIIELLLEEHFGNMKNEIATDYKATLVCKTVINLPQEMFPITYRLEDEDEPAPRARTYQVRVVATGSLDVAPLLQYLSSPRSGEQLPAKEEIIQALNIVLGHHPKTNRELLSIGANKHFPLGRAGESYDLSGGLTALKGFFVSVRAATSRLLVNVQVKATPCYSEGRLPDIINSFSASVRGPAHMNKLNRFLKGVRVRVNHIVHKNKSGKVILRIKTIEGLAHQSDGRNVQNPPQVPWLGAGPKDVKFFLDGPTPTAEGQSQKSGKKQKKGPVKPGGDSPTGSYISVYDYFKRNYPNITELNNALPVVNVGSREKPSYLPAEVCHVLPGQPANAKISPQQTQHMIRFAVQRPVENAKSIVVNGTKVLGVTPHLNPMLAGMGLSLLPDLITVPGRVLEGPITVQYKGQSFKNPQGGNWNLQKVAFSQGSQLPAWTYLYYQDGRTDPAAVMESVDRFIDMARVQGLAVPAPSRPIVVNVPPRRDLEDIPLDPIFAEIRQQSRVRLVLVILPFASPQIYSQVKYRGDIKDGIHTICVVAEKFRKNQPQYFANVALKFNLKLGGVNHKLQPSKLGIISEGKTMVVGIDVTHPAPGSLPTAPSIAGMVASVDKVLGQWPASIRLQQQARAEMVSDLDQMLQSRLLLWQKNNAKSLPENILIYRDGVSEGQYGKVLDEELPLLRSACKAIYPADKTKKGLPKLTIIIVGKRHNTRFYPTDLKDADNNSNPNNGTVVDRGVTETRHWDFFLQAHTALQGTARPAHYYVILDEIFNGRKTAGRFNSIADELEDLTHNLCYLFGRATKAVSICPPAYYADLVCERARRYLSRYFDVTPDTSVASSGAGDVGPVPVGDDVRIHSDLVDTMFYI
ncbi:hypothetical protein ACJ73_02841 [Blastomyces percursus]|uniref:Piwi domain-containing protein n=1 Tax=Blastomyces percursus TaxID=1658174 RepID=A0A1J9QB67_9EURO|nr:hypothetical protein ACJ73_02841 [Blastomyces percursus]